MTFHLLDLRARSSAPGPAPRRERPASSARGLVDGRPPFGDVLIGVLSGQRLDPSDVGADRRLPEHDQGTHLGGGVGVGAATQFGGELADLDQPDRLAVLVAKEGQGALAFGLFFRRDGRRDMAVLDEAVVGQ